MPDTLYIVGAGFSAHAGIPLASGFTKALLDVAKYKAGPSQGLVEVIRAFVADAFAHGPSSAAKYWPELEDLFTCIDLSANTGHHLGRNFSPADLRMVRRALLVRIIRMIPQAYSQGEATAGTEWKRLERFFAAVDPARSAFLSMNWDHVIETGLETTHGVRAFDYGCDAVGAVFKKDRLTLAPEREAGATILKPHGSINWLYCDACQKVFYCPPVPYQTQRIARQLFRDTDWQRAKTFADVKAVKTGTSLCPRCDADALGTRFATFSYRKALDFPMHAKTWQRAEALLYAAKSWVFIGYSLPGADFEFKHLLKRVQLTRTTAPNLILITGGNPDGAEATRANYQKFFGPAFSMSRGHVFLNGLDAKARDHLARVGCLSPR